MRTFPRLALLLTLTAATIGVVPHAASATTASCASLVGTHEIAGARTQVTSAVEEAGACDVHGVIEPAVGFELKLPLTTYSGRYLQYGCSGFCGVTLPPAVVSCGGPPGGDLAVASTDDGHISQNPFPLPFTDGSFAQDPAARADWQYRAPHVLSVAAKRLIAEFYGAPPVHSYFNGCSTGGREAMLLAQRYPHDFNGIIAGSPNLIMSPWWGMYLPWVTRSNTAADGSPIVTAAKLPALHEAVLAACDTLDGLRDNQIDDPRACSYDPAALRCAGADAPTCLTAEQVSAARKLYAGPTDARGHRLYPGAMTRGSELAWDTFAMAGGGFPEPFAKVLADNYLRYAGYPLGTPHSSVASVPLTVREFHRQSVEGARGNAMSLDLRAFRAAGGKLIMWHGWDDQSIPSYGTLDYYQRMADHMGGMAATRQWARLFMIPGLYHCAMGGYALTEFDPTQQLLSWVETGAAPASVQAAARDTAGAVTRTRPVYAYPERATYNGTGDPDDATNFHPTTPAHQPAARIHWVGEYLYHLPARPVAP